MLSETDVPALERHLAGTLDATSHRLDAWVTSLATRRLAELRATQPTGLAAGGYAWLENLPPGHARTDRRRGPGRAGPPGDEPRRPRLHPRAVTEPGQCRRVAPQRAPGARRRPELPVRDRAELGPRPPARSSCSRVSGRASRSARCSATRSSAPSTMRGSTTSSTTSARSRPCPEPRCRPASVGSWSTGSRSRRSGAPTRRRCSR